MEQTVTQAVVDGVWHGVEGAAGGVAIAMIHAKMSAAPAAPAASDPPTPPAPPTEGA